MRRQPARLGGEGRSRKGVHEKYCCCRLCPGLRGLGAVTGQRQCTGCGAQNQRNPQPNARKCTPGKAAAPRRATGGDGQLWRGAAGGNRPQRQRRRGGTIPVGVPQLGRCRWSRIPSLDVQQRAPGTSADLSIRGSTFEETLILVNGLRLNDAQTGHNNLDIPFPFESVQRIEVLKGAGSTLYGSDAMGGAVNFITARAGDERDSPGRGHRQLGNEPAEWSADPGAQAVQRTVDVCARAFHRLHRGSRLPQPGHRLRDRDQHSDWAQRRAAGNQRPSLWRRWILRRAAELPKLGARQRLAGRVDAADWNADQRGLRLPAAHR